MGRRWIGVILSISGVRYPEQRCFRASRTWLLVFVLGFYLRSLSYRSQRVDEVCKLLRLTKPCGWILGLRFVAVHNPGFHRIMQMSITIFR